MEKPTEHFDWAEDVVFDIDDLKKSSPAPTASQASVTNNSKTNETVERRYNGPSSSRRSQSLVVSRDQTKEQHDLMKQKIEAARRRKEQELAEEEARKQERIRVLLEGLDLKQKQKADEHAQQEHEREQERQRQREVRRQALKQRQEQIKAEKSQAEKLQEEKLKKQSRDSFKQCDQRINDTVPRAVLPPTGPATHGPSLDSIQALQSKIQRKLSCSPDSSRHSNSANSDLQKSGASLSHSKVPAGPKRTLMRRPASISSQPLESPNNATIVQHYTTADISNDSLHLKPVVKLNLGLEGEFDTPVGSDIDEATPRSALIYSDFAQSSSKLKAVAASTTNPENDYEIVVDVPSQRLGRY